MGCGAAVWALLSHAPIVDLGERKMNAPKVTPEGTELLIRPVYAGVGVSSTAAARHQARQLGDNRPRNAGVDYAAPFRVPELAESRGENRPNREPKLLPLHTDHLAERVVREWSTRIRPRFR